MRSPKRIPYFLSLLEESWLKVPDMRFGQLIENLKRYIGRDGIFYIEDDEMMTYIKNYCDSIAENTIYNYSQDEICPACGRYSVDGDVCLICQKNAGIHNQKI